MGNPHRTKSARPPSCILSRPKYPSREIIKPVIKVVQIHNPVYVQTDAINFPSLVQQLTGMKTRLPRSLQPHRRWRRSCSAGEDDDDDNYAVNRLHDWSSAKASNCDEIFDWNSGSAPPRSNAGHSSESCSSYASFYDASCSPNYSTSTSEGFDYELYHDEAKREYGEAFSNMTVGVQRFTELDIWAGLASDRALPDITMLPPLLL